MQWLKSLDDKWLNLMRLNFDRIQDVGVYIIWHGGDQPRVVRVGQGDIGSILRSHSINPMITRYQSAGPLLVTWAAVESLHHRDGIENFLAQQYYPLVGSNFPNVPPIAVASPFV